MTHLSVFVEIMHAIVTFLLSDDFSCIFHDDLIRFECAIRSNSMTSIKRFTDFDTNIVLASSLRPLAQLLESAVGAMFRTNVAIAAVALVKHEAVEAVLIAAALGGANTFR